jgi:hypothetical protein
VLGDDCDEWDCGGRDYEREGVVKGTVVCVLELSACIWIFEVDEVVEDNMFGLVDDACGLGLGMVCIAMEGEDWALHIAELISWEEMMNMLEIARHCEALIVLVNNSVTSQRCNNLLGKLGLEWFRACRYFEAAGVISAPIQPYFSNIMRDASPKQLRLLGNSASAPLRILKWVAFFILSDTGIMR